MVWVGIQPPDCDLKPFRAHQRFRIPEDLPAHDAAHSQLPTHPLLPGQGPTQDLGWKLRLCDLPVTSVVSVVEPECEKSSATTYFWYREALDISNSISESGGLNWKMTLCLLVAWSIVGMAVVKGIQSSGKVSRGKAAGSQRTGAGTPSHQGRTLQ